MHSPTKEGRLWSMQMFNLSSYAIVARVIRWWGVCGNTSICCMELLFHYNGGTKTKWFDRDVILKLYRKWRMKGCLISSHGIHNGDSKNERCETLLKAKLSKEIDYAKYCVSCHQFHFVLLNTNCRLLVLCHQHLMVIGIWMNKKVSWDDSTWKLIQTKFH